MPAMLSQVVDALVSSGFLHTRLGPAGEAELAVPRRMFYFAPVVSLSEPALEASISPVSSSAMQLSTLDLLSVLHREGFEGTDDRLASWLPADRQKLYRLQSVKNGSRLYFVSLVRRAALASKGLLAISHYGPASYYRALLCVKEPQKVQVALDDQRQPAAVFDEMMSDAGALDDAPAAAEEDDVLMPDLTGIDVQEGLSRLSRFVVSQEQLRPFPLPDRGDILPSGVVVNFSPPWSHGSGQLRGFIKCPWGHTDCWKYQQQNVAGSRERLVSFLSAWAVMGAGFDRSEHSCATPAEAMVDAQQAFLFPEK